MCGCRCVSVCVCRCVCMCCVFACMHVCVHLCACVCMCVYACAHQCVIIPFEEQQFSPCMAAMYTLGVIIECVGVGYTHTHHTHTTHTHVIHINTPLPVSQFPSMAFPFSYPLAFVGQEPCIVGKCVCEVAMGT